MPTETAGNDLGGKSIYVTPPSDFAADSKVASRLSSDERRAALGFGRYFGELSQGAPPESSAFLGELARATPIALELHHAPYDERLSGTFFRVELPSGTRLRVGIRGGSRPAEMPPWLADFYGVVGATREEDWQVSGGFLFADRLGALEPPSEYAKASPIDTSAVPAFFAAYNGDYACYGPDAKCYWFGHETESLTAVHDPRALIYKILTRHISGEKVEGP